MNKKKPRKGGKKPKSQPKQDWKKYLLAPLAIGAAVALGARFCTSAQQARHDSAGGTELNQDTAAERAKKKKPEKILMTSDLNEVKQAMYSSKEGENKEKRLVTVSTSEGKKAYFVFPVSYFDAVFKTACCEVTVLKPEYSPVIGNLLRTSLFSPQETFSYQRATRYRALTFGTTRSEGGSIRGFCLLKHPLKLDHIFDQLENTLFGLLTQSTKLKVSRVAKQGDLEQRKQLVDYIAQKMPYRADANIHIMRHIIERQNGKEEADKLMKRVASGFILRRALEAKVDKGLERKRANFTNMAVHEMVHAAQRVHHGGNKVHETFGFGSEIAYGDNCWYGLYRIATLSAIHIPELEMKYHEANQTLTQRRRKSLEAELQYKGFFHELLDKLSIELGISNPLELLEKSEEEIRKAAQLVLDKESMGHFGKRFLDTVSIRDIENIRRQGSNFVEENYEKW